MQAAALIADDIMDGAETRRGQPCWYLTEGVGYSAVNDALMLENVVYLLLKKYFADKSCYVKLLELFHETTLQTIFGQCLDTKYGVSCDVET
jgi:farnesyl diphosphate synthase